MKHFFTFLFVCLAFSGCRQDSAVESEFDLTDAGPGDAVVSFVPQSLVEVSRATVTAESWERTVNQAAVVVVKRPAAQATPAGSDQVAMIHTFSALELSNLRAIFSLYEGTSTILRGSTDRLSFYALVNQPLVGIAVGSTRTQVEALTETTPSITAYNGTYAEVTSGAKLSGGFVMSTKTPFEAALDPNTDKPVAAKLNLLRTVAKVKITTRTSNVADEGTAAVPAGKSFEALYRGPIPGSAPAANYTSEIRIDKIEVDNDGAAGSKGWSTASGLFATAAWADGPNFSQDTKQTAAAGRVSGDNLLYVYEQSKPLKIKLYGKFALDGNFGNAAAGNLVDVGPYKLSLPAAGKLDRNSFYTINVLINGLTANEVVASFEVDDWTQVATETVSIGG